MPEGSKHAAILIATSYQALNRAKRGNPDTLLTDCTVLVLFAGFYVEATLNHIIEQTGKEAAFHKFPLSKRNHQGKKYPGMQDKLAWFYNEFIDQTGTDNWVDLYKTSIKTNLKEKFPGFEELCKFRNYISHGEINELAESLATAERLRQQAKSIVEQLYNITTAKGYNVTRLETYHDALASLTNKGAVQISETSSS